MTSPGVIIGDVVRERRLAADRDLHDGLRLGVAEEAAMDHGREGVLGDVRAAQSSPSASSKSATTTRSTVCLVETCMIVIDPNPTMVRPLPASTTE